MDKELNIPVLVVLSYNLKSPEEITDVLERMNFPLDPNFAGEARIVIGDDVKDVIAFLDEPPEKEV